MSEMQKQTAKIEIVFDPEMERAEHFHPDIGKS